MTTRLQDHYDWIVLGNHPGALLSASLVAHLGLSVLILPLAPGLGFFISRSGQYFDPESNHLVGLGKFGKLDGLILQCLHKLGATPLEESKVDFQSSSFQVVTPHTRLVLAGNEVFHSELSREYGKTLANQMGIVSALKHSEADFLTYWYNLPKRLTLSSSSKSSLVEPKTLRELRRKLTHHLSTQDAALLSWISESQQVGKFSNILKMDDFKEACLGLYYGATSSVRSELHLFEVLQALSLSRTGASFKGGLTSYREFLVNLAKRMGAHVALKTECRRLFVSKGRLVGVQVTGHGNMVSVGGGVLGCSLEQAFQRITFTGRDWLRSKKTGPKIIGWKFTLALSVYPESIPKGMLKRVFWQEKGAPVLEIEVVEPTQYNLNESKTVTLYLRTIMPFTEESLKLEFQNLIAGRMIRQAIEIIPFLEAHLTRVYPDFRVGAQKVQSPGNLGTKTRTKIKEGSESQTELEALYGFSSLSAVPENLLLYAGKGPGSGTGVDGLFMATDEAYPEMGTLGPTIATLEAVAWLAHRSGMPGPFS